MPTRLTKRAWPATDRTGVGRTIKEPHLGELTAQGGGGGAGDDGTVATPAASLVARRRGRKSGNTGWGGRD